MTQSSWYKDGLRFECTRCGNCCGGGPGLVHVTDEEIATLAKRLGFADAEFRERYTRPYRNGILILNEQPNYDCIFYDREKGCTVYEDRPRQCRTWPFWKKIVRSPETWAETAKGCPGINSGQLYSKEQIHQLSESDGTCSSAVTSPARPQ